MIGVFEALSHVQWRFIAIYIIAYYRLKSMVQKARCDPFAHLCTLPHPSNPLNHHRNPLPHPNTHRAKRVTSFDAMQLVHSRRHQPRPGRAEWMPQRNRPAIRVHTRVVVMYTEHAQHGQPLRV